MRFLFVILVSVALLGCKKKEVPKPPDSAQLLFPERSSECTAGRAINETTSEVEFRWQASNNTESYELKVTELATNRSERVNTSSTSGKLTLRKGAAYAWVVTSKNSAVLQTVASETWQFYNAGSESTYAPFPAEIITPKMGATAFRDINNEVELSWRGTDVDNDINGYEVYFSTESPPEALIFSPGANGATLKVAVASNTVYYWIIITKDTEGNSSESGIFEFRAQ